MPNTYQYVDTTGALKTTTDQSVTPGIASNSGIQTISSSSLTPTSPVQIPPYVPPQVASPDVVANQPSTVDPVTGSTSDLLSQIKSTIEKQGTKSARQGQLETDAGLPDLQKQLNEINAQIGSYTAQAKQFQVNQEGRQAPMFAITGAQAQAERQLSAKTFGLAAAAQALQGNIALAKDNVQRALSAEFDPLESQLKYQETLLNVNQANLSKIDKAKADAAALKLEQEKQKLADAKAEKANIYKLVLDAGQNRASNTVLQAIQSAPDYATALSIASKAGVLATPKSSGGGTPIGKGTPAGFTQSDIKAGDSILRTGIDSAGTRIGNPIGSDGYIDPGVYVALLNHWIQAQGTRDSFFSYYPVDRYINPANTWVWDSLGIANPKLQAGYKGTVVAPKSSSRSL